MNVISRALSKIERRLISKRLLQKMERSQTIKETALIYRLIFQFCAHLSKRLQIVIIKKLARCLTCAYFEKERYTNFRK